MFHIRPFNFSNLDAADQVLMLAYRVPSRRVELERWMHLGGTTWLAGLELLQAAGFSRQRTLRHIARGNIVTIRRLEHIYGQSSFMLG